MTAKRPPTRRPITERMKIDALLDRADYFGSPITCAWCGNPLKAQTPIQWDHSTALALGGEHTFRNIHPMHVACHHEKTHGNGASTAGSDIGKISKERRIIRTQKFLVHKPMDQADEALWSIAQAKKAKRPIKSPGFPKGHRPMRRKSK